MNNADNKIPPITDSMGAHWKQPERDSITIDDTHALMDKAAWDKLAAYDRSNPSGVYDGKMWKRDDRLVWYGPGMFDDCCQINSREVLIV